VNEQCSLQISGIKSQFASSFFWLRAFNLRIGIAKSSSSVAHAKIVNLVHDPLFEDRLGNSPRKAARQSVTWEEPRSLLPSENSIPQVFARPCISQRRNGEAPSSINGLKRPEVSLETL
jgi:hypothetical protein